MATVQSDPTLASVSGLTLPTLENQVDDYRKRLLEEAGLKVGRPSHFKKPVERGFTKDDRDTTTVL